MKNIEENTRPGDVLLQGYLGGNNTAIDVSVASPFQEASTDNASMDNLDMSPNNVDMFKDIDKLMEEWSLTVHKSNCRDASTTAQP